MFNKCVKMRALLSCILMCGFVFSIETLTCRTDGGPKEEQLKTLYTNCLKSQNDSNSSNSREFSHNRRESNNRERDYNDHNSSRERRKQNQNQQWDRKSDAFGSRDDWSGGSSDRSNKRDRTSSRDDWGSGGTGREGSSGAGRYDRMPMGSSQDRMPSSRDRGMNGRDDYMESPDYGGDMPRYNNNFRSSTQPSRRMKRERSSGHRSQYNPNTSQKTSGNNHRNNERNSSENSTQDDSTQACALHCFLEELEMTGENGMPDRYLVTQVLTKGVNNEDLRDFLQESTDECFQILYNENGLDKCDFSKNLMMCLSEKGRANCDDWKDDLKF